MAIRTSVEINGDPLREIRDSYGARGLAEFGQVVGSYMLSKMVDRLVTSYVDDGYRTGLLSNSLGIGHPQNIFELGRDGNGMAVTAGSRVEYAAQQNFGGVIRPRNAKMLAIPLTDAVKRSLQSPKDMDPERNIFSVIPARDGESALLVDTEGVLGFGTKPLFLLRRSVKQEGKNFMRWDQEDMDVLPELFDSFIGGRVA